MNSTTASGKGPSSGERAAEREAAPRAAKHWVHQFARTIKSCRVYGSLTNPIVERARLELARELEALVGEHGALVLRFTSDDVFFDDVSLYPARSREDNFALPFYRDGIRKITFSMGTTPAEVDVVVDAILRVTGLAQTDNDLVTLLWQAQLEHVEIEYVPTDAEVGGSGAMGEGFGSGSGAGGGTGAGGHGSEGRRGTGGLGFGAGAGDGEGGASGRGSGDGAASAAYSRTIGGGGAPGANSESEPGVPWPQGATTEPEGADAPSSDAPSSETSTSTEAAPGRSDDWQVASDTVAAEAVFEELDLAVAPGLESFRARLEAERQASAVASAVQLSRAYLAASETEDDRVDLARFFPRVIRQAAVDGAWREAGEALALFEQCESPAGSLDALAEEVCQPAVVSAAAASVAALEPERVPEFTAFARRLGDGAIDLLGRVLVEIDGSRHQAQVVEAIADECRSCPERLAPWLSDPRWTVVRTTVRILGRIGGDATVGLLEAVAGHPEPAVREEVVAALRGASLKRAKPILFALLDDADTPTFCAIVQHLGQSRDREVGEVLLEYVTHADFERQPIEERRAVYAAVATAGGDDVLPGLEAELQMPHGSGRVQDAHRQAIALAIAQIGTPRAKQVLQGGARSQRQALREACGVALARLGRP